MNIKKYVEKNTCSLKGRTVAVTGSCGGLGRPLCKYLAGLGADLILLDRDPVRSAAHRDLLQKEHPHVSVRCIPCELSDIDSVKAAVAELTGLPLYAVVHNAGAYSIPRCTTSVGVDNVFQINFLSPYYMTKALLPTLRKSGGRVVAVGSVAHNYSKTDKEDPDFSTRKKASLVYGNAKRHLMCALWGLFREEREAHLAVTHPGISFTGITNHYPPLLFALIKHPMKVIFMKPKKAALSLLRGLFCDTGECEWIGPSLFGVWGYPKKSTLTTCTLEERERVFREAEEMYDGLLSHTTGERV